jgi:hypothetical protein
VDLSASLPGMAGVEATAAIISEFPLAKLGS